MTALAVLLKDGTLALENEMEKQNDRAQLDIPTHSCKVGICVTSLSNERKEKGQGLTQSLPGWLVLGDQSSQRVCC